MSELLPHFKGFSDSEAAEISSVSTCVHMCVCVCGTYVPMHRERKVAVLNQGHFTHIGAKEKHTHFSRNTHCSDPTGPAALLPAGQP